jgi:hypothetical protein
VPFAAGPLKLLRGDMEAAVQFAKHFTHRFIGGTIHQQRAVVERHLNAEHPGELREQAILKEDSINKVGRHVDDFSPATPTYFSK